LTLDLHENVPNSKRSAPQKTQTPIRPLFSQAKSKTLKARGEEAQRTKVTTQSSITKNMFRNFGSSSVIPAKLIQWKMLKPPSSNPNIAKATPPTIAAIKI
ncbi:hypothetical protein, partial [Rhodovulum sulfidophilum]|uniref:hypothetical protein n=1 Tax=Rhodovulum sulfidophilum TaxID=35806 RepID=UPI001EE430C6